MAAKEENESDESCMEPVPVRRRVLESLWRMFVLNLQGRIMSRFDKVESDFEASLRSKLPRSEFPDQTDQSIWVSRTNILAEVADATKAAIVDFEDNLAEETVRSHYETIHAYYTPNPMEPPTSSRRKRRRKKK